MASPKVVAAAHAAASWARARRSVWADPNVPLPPVPPVAIVPPPAVVAPSPVVAPPPAAAAPPAPAPAARIDVADFVADPFDDEIAAPPDPILTAPTVETIEPPRLELSKEGEPTSPLVGAAARALPRLAAAAALVVVAVVGGRYLLTKIGSSSRQDPDTASTAPSAPTQAGRGTAAAAPPQPTATPGRRPVGTLHITSTPVGAQVILDGKPRGVTPLDIPDVPAGAHPIEIVSAEGTVKRSVTVAADRTTEVNESIFSGWVALRAPFDVTVTEGARGLASDERGQIMLAAGTHDLRLVNRRLVYDETRRVEIKPGEIATLSIANPRSTISVTASEPAEVWVDGVRVGATPLADAPIEVGTRDIVVKRASGGERRVTATVTTKPYTLAIDFSK